MKMIMSENPIGLVKTLVSGWDYPASRKIPSMLLFFGWIENALPSA
jgi:hypothetical protein